MYLCRKEMTKLQFLYVYSSCSIRDSISTIYPDPIDIFNEIRFFAHFEIEIGKFMLISSGRHENFKE